MKLWLPSKCFRGSSHEPCEVGQGLCFPDGETEAQRRLMTCQTENMASPILRALYPAIPTLDMLHQLLVTHSSSFSTSPSAAGDRARAGQRQQQSLGSFTPVPKTTPHPKGIPAQRLLWGVLGTTLSSPTPGWGARYSSQSPLQEPSAHGSENPLDIFATTTGGGEYPDASSLVICCKMAQPCRANPGVPQAGGP